MRFSFLAALLLPLLAPAQASRFTTIGRVVAQVPAFNQLIAPGTPIEIVASGFSHAEGPLWVADSAMLLFSDSPTRTIYRWSEQRGLSKFLEGSGFTGRMPYGKEPGTNGLALDAQGNLLLAEHGDRRVALLPLGQPNGKRTLADAFEGRRYNSPNDLVMHPNGSLYFTDPPYGLPQQAQSPLREQPGSYMYRRSPNGRVTREITDLTLPNGLALTADGRQLFVAQSDSLQPIIKVYPVRGTGKLGPGKLFFDMQALPRRAKEVPDGLKLDRAGNVWASGHGGLVVLSPQGQHLGTIEVGEVISNCAWGNDGRTLYFTAGSMVCRVKTLVQGTTGGR
ncbi:SMP-30/gluconolactonase/LRE family protein [Hymenobacter pini]|uniref:SMP-30/gluconolactonase/LRE family protein n=1 Tax=Hymenobacter pini TaxID=2880879 RepID=UPI001CF3971E|nr:SMP-30/gluconolactonase/LRE family protein [Hymenobacter pini]MCA8829509.1 SMP-30/gluconolactonase/LRE family protein [Hymenobacter pini]